MSGNLKNPYGLRDCELVHAGDVVRGLACNCTCPACGDRLQAHKGRIRQPYFSHRSGADCGAGYQTALHILAKEILAEYRKVVVPPLTVYTAPALIHRFVRRQFSEDLVKSGTLMTFKTAELEKRVGEIIPDVVLAAQGWKLLVEIRVSHAVDDAKAAKTRQLDISAIEFDLSKTNRSVSRRELTQILTTTYGPARVSWIHNRDQAAAQDRVNRQYLDLFRPKPDDSENEAPTDHRLWAPPCEEPILPPCAPKKPSQLSLFQR